ncbi:MAG: PocR ligand-binding domain-containing protein [Lachnospiraceae bacterium]|nr:PocR ligand-binding domain-containing protein [Lachnospiraceae bacterium]
MAKGDIMKDVRLIDLMDVKALQKIQDEFSKYTGMAALTTDENGIPITKGSGFTNFCTNLVRTTRLGCRRCEECDKNGAVMTLENKRATVYSCHAGLTDFAAPIMLEGKMIGSFIGGQVRTQELDEEKMTVIAQELGISPEIFISEARKARQLNLDDVERAAEFLEGIAGSLSEMAYHNYLALQKSRKMENAARAQADFIMNMYNDVDAAKIPKEVRDVVDYIRHLDGKIEIRETHYKLKDLRDVIYKQVIVLVDREEIDFDIVISDNAPELLLGDAGRIGQIVVRILHYILRYKINGKLHVRFDVKKRSYASMLCISIEDYDSEIPQDEGKKILRYVTEDSTVNEPEDASLISIRLLKLLFEQISAEADLRRDEDNTVHIDIAIPQLAL